MKSRPGSEGKNVAYLTNLAITNWYLLLMEISVTVLLLLPRNTVLKNPQREIHSLVANRTLSPAAWNISEKNVSRKEFQRQLTSLLQLQDTKVQRQIAICPGEFWLVGGIKNKLMHFDVMQFIF